MLDETAVADRLGRLASSLGWPELRSLQHELRDGALVRWFESGCRDHIRLQINHHPHGQNQTFNAIVFALRFRLCSGWHQFQLPSHPPHLTEEVERVRTWLDFSWYATDGKRREFRKLHPECAGMTWSRLMNIEQYHRGQPFLFAH